LPAQDVGQEDVVGDAGVHENLHLAELLTRDSDGARLHLHPPDRGNLVRLDVRPVADSMSREMGLHAADVVSHDLEIDGDDGRVQIRDGSHVCPFLRGCRERRERRGRPV